MRARCVRLRSWLRPATLTCVLSSTIVCGAQGQRAGADETTSSKRVRLHFGVDEATVVGRFVVARGDSILFLPDGGREPMIIRPERLTSIDTSAGRRWGIARGMGVGALIGTTAGLIAASTVHADSACTSPQTAPFSCSLGGFTNATLVGVVQAGLVASGLAGGTLVGMVVGALHRGENWSIASIGDLRGDVRSKRFDGSGPMLAIVPRRNGVAISVHASF